MPTSLKASAWRSSAPIGTTSACDKVRPWSKPSALAVAKSPCSASSNSRSTSAPSPAFARSSSPPASKSFPRKTTKANRRKATEIAANIISSTDDLVGIAGFDSESGPGFGLAIKEAERAGQIVATCVDAEKPHLQLVKDGVITACVGQKRELFTYLGVKALFEVNRRRLKFTADDQKLGLHPIPTHYYTGTYTVTKDNVDYFLA